MVPDWEYLHEVVTREWLGLLPEMLNDANPAPAREQFDRGYQHGGGWRPFVGFKLLGNGCILYPGDPSLRPLARTQLRDEKITLFECSWVMIQQPDGSYEIARMD